LALQQKQDHLPPLYRAVVQAGVRSGRLASALECLSDHLRDHLETQRMIGLALLYPLLVIALAYGLFIAFLVFIVPVFLDNFEASRLPGLMLLRWFDLARQTMPYWVLALPLLIVALAFSWRRAGRAAGFGSGPGSGWIRRLPGVRRLLSDSSAASFSGLLALLIDHEVPFAEAIELAGAASGDSALEVESRAIAGAVRRGEGAARAVDLSSQPGGMPALLGWLLGTGYRQGNPVPALRHAERTYRRRTRARAEVLRTVLPTFMIVWLGGIAVLLYTLAVFVPFATLLRELSRSI
jgi:general secretion pathway protein F